MFNANANLAVDAQSSIRQLGAIVNAFQESGQDLLQAAQGLRQSDFASSLQDSVQILLSTREQLTDRTQTCTRSTLYVESVQKASWEDEQRLAERGRAAGEAVDNLCQQLRTMGEWRWSPGKGPLPI